MPTPFWIGFFRLIGLSSSLSVWLTVYDRCMAYYERQRRLEPAEDVEYARFVCRLLLYLVAFFGILLYIAWFDGRFW
jgi:hypothetical protein